MTAIRTLGSGGEIALGDEHAGQQVMMAELEPGVWIIKAAELIPRSELWLHEPANAASLDRGLRWIADNPPAPTNLEDVRRRIEE